MRGSAHGGGAGADLRRWVGVGLGLIAVAAITLGVLGSLSHTSDRDVHLDARAPLSGATTATQSARRAPTAARSVVPALARAPVTAAELRLQTALSRALRSAGPDSGAVVDDLSARQELYALRATVKRPPASVEKLYTTTALMRMLGPSTRLHTALLATGHLRAGVWHGDLYLRGGGDPTFGDSGFNLFWDQGYGPTASQLVAQLTRRGIRRVTGFVYGDESLFDRRRGGLMTDYAPDTPDLGGQLSALTYDHGTTAPHLSPATFAAREVVLTMRGAGIRAKASKRSAHTPTRAQLLAIVGSPPMSVMTRLMDVPSDDLFAELFTKQLGVRFGGAGSISAGARVISRTIAAAYGLHPVIRDGSGLSRSDRSSPLEIVDLLRELWSTPTGNQLYGSLPIVGQQGTVQSVGAKTAAQGRCVAKTGTLDYVTNLVGYCHSRAGPVLDFAFFLDGPPNYIALGLESQMIGAVARY